ncbi:MAG: hypothetical protein ACYSWU_27900, partial [Planctomycetota bacterium]
MMEPNFQANREGYLEYWKRFDRYVDTSSSVDDVTSIKGEMPPRKRRGPTTLPHLPTGRYEEAPYYAEDYLHKETAAENVAWRLHWRKAAMKDRGLQKVYRQAAFEDVLFFFNAFCWLFEPRAADKIRPFATWPHQDPAIIALDEAISRSEGANAPVDVVIDKSRGQGATWMCLLVILRRWLRDEMFSAGLVTRTEDTVDSLRDPDALMWKIVWALKMLPPWMRPEGLNLTKHRNVTEHSLLNPMNGASIVGYSATGDVARGGRKSVFMMDELATFKPGDDYSALNSTQHVTDCRFLVSTFRGDSGAYYEAATSEGNALKIILDWKDNPTQNRNLYEYIDGKIRSISEDKKEQGSLISQIPILREQHTKLAMRGYKIADKVRNRWYNEQCLRPGATPLGIAQELDRNPKGTVAKVFSPEAINNVKTLCARPPLVRGRLVFDPESLDVRSPWVSESDVGELKLWCQPGLDGILPIGSYVIGVDISAGTAGDYSSNSVACVINKMT